MVIHHRSFYKGFFLIKYFDFELVDLLISLIASPVLLTQGDFEWFSIV